MQPAADDELAPSGRAVGRYVLYGEIAAGGMGAVHYGRSLGSRGFSRPVAIKRLHPQNARDPHFVSMFLDEARIAARVRHPNVVSTLDVVEEHGEVLIVMDFVEGLSLGTLISLARERRESVPLPIASRIIGDLLAGLESAHEAKSDDGTPLQIVHCDVSPQNLLVGSDGVSRVVDFGIAKAIDRGQYTLEGEVRGKLRYLAPEQAGDGAVDRRADVYSTGVVLWELLVGRSMRDALDLPRLAMLVATGEIVAPSTLAPERVSDALEVVVLRALQREPAARFAFARLMAAALAEAAPPATAAEVAAWAFDLGGDRIRTSASYLARMARSVALEASPAAMRQPELPTLDERSPAPARPPLARRRVLVRSALGVVAFAALAIGVLAWGATPDHGAQIAAALPSADLPAPAAPSASIAVAIVASAPSSVTASPLAAAPAISRGVGRGVPLTRARAASTKSCAIPFVVDSSGVRIPRPECM